MGVVFRARDSRLGRDVALKCPWPRLSTDAVGRHRFLREARATSRLAHPTIVPIYEVFEDRDLPWIAMELVEGRMTLAEVLASGEPLPLDQILQHAEDLADALRAAHAKGILHRDIKPSNVLLGTDGRARLTDFGLARFFAPTDRPPEAPADGTSAVTEEGKVVGTIAYMAPEMLLGSPPDPRNDIFSLGVIIYEMCTGRAAFGPSSKWDAYQAVLRREPAAIARFNYEIPRSLERLVRKALAKRPEERYQDARDMLADIRTIRRRVASGTFDIEEELDIGRSRPRVATWLLLGASASMLLLAGWMGVTSARKKARPTLGTPRQLTTAPGAETDAAVSPTGNLVAYASDESGNFDIWLVDAKGGNPIRLTDDPASDRDPAWFPDGSSIAFVSERGGAKGIWKVASLGGSATLLVPNAIDPAISHDGRRIAFTRPDDSAYPRVFVAAIDAPDQAKLLVSEEVGRWGLMDPAWSPKDETIVFSDFEHLWVAKVADGTARQLTTLGDQDSRPAWSADGRAIFFSSFREGTFALWRIDADGTDEQRLSYGSGPEVSPSVSPAGDVLAFSTFVDDRDVGLKDLATGAFVRIRSQLTDYAPDLSPDGRRLIFNTYRWGGSATIASIDLDKLRPTGAIRKLTDWNDNLPRWSPDGRWIAFGRNEQRSRDVRDLWVLPADGGEAIRFDDDPAADVQPAWSPDGKRLAFASERDGLWQIWVKGIENGHPAGAATRVTSGRATNLFPEWSPDGRSIAFIRSDGFGTDAWMVDVADGHERRLTKAAEAQLVRWLPGSQGMLVAAVWDRAEYEIRRIDPVSGASRSLTPPVVLGPDSASALFDVDASGKKLAMTVYETRGDIWLIQGSPGSF
jgi:eukaryotic-like serine/threonine-protein kinase